MKKGALAYNYVTFSKVSRSEKMFSKNNGIKTKGYTGFPC